MTPKQARFIKPAELEFEHAIDHYNLERPGLGFEFADRVEATLLQAIDFPEAGSVVTHRRLRTTVRRFQVHGPFPYDLVATRNGDELLVLAVAHHKRRPTYWIRRLSGG